MNPIIVYKTYNELLVIRQDGSYTVSIGDSDIRGIVNNNILDYIVTTLTSNNMTDSSYGTTPTHNITSAKGEITYNYHNAPNYIKGLSVTLDTIINNANPRLVEYIVEYGIMKQTVIIRMDGTAEVRCDNTDNMSWELDMGECNQGVRHIQSSAMRILRSILSDIPPHSINQRLTSTLPISTIATYNGITTWETKIPDDMIDVTDFVLNILHYW